MLVSRCENDSIYDVMEACHFTHVLCWYCMLNAFKTIDLILTRGVFVNIDCESEASDSD